MKNKVFVSLFLILPIIFFSVLHRLDNSHSISDSYKIADLEYVISSSQSPPDAQHNWQPTTLPFQIEHSLGLTPSVWLRLQIRSDEYRTVGGNSTQAGLLFLSPYANLAIYINELLVGQEGRMSPPLSYYRRALLFRLPPIETNNDYVTLFVHIVKPRPGGSVKPFYFAPELVLKPTYDNDLFLKLRLPQGILVAMGFIATIMGLLFLLRRSETAYGWYALMLIFWLLHHSQDLVVNIPVENYWLWVAFSYISLGWFVIFGGLFATNFLDMKQPRIEKAVVVLGLIGSHIAVYLAISDGYAVVYFGQTWWVPAINVLGICVVIHLYRGVRKDPSLDKKGLLLVTYLVSVVGVRDYIFDVYPSVVPGTAYYLQYSSGFVLVFFSLMLMRRFASALEEAENLNRGLEQTIAQKTKELEHNFQRLKEAERENTVAGERERIMRDMHDGFGGQLIQVLSLVENTPELAPIEPTIRDALQDLRLVIDSLADTEDNLLVMLGAFRHRISLPVKKSGIELIWQVDDFDTTPQLSPSMTLQVLRILQEAVTNTIKHSGATELSITTTVQPHSSININIRDNGKGYDVEGQLDGSGDADSEVKGHGIINMQHRAQRIKAVISVESTPLGTQVSLELPCG